MGRGHVHLRLGVRYLEYRALQWTQALTTQRRLLIHYCYQYFQSVPQLVSSIERLSLMGGFVMEGSTVLYWKCPYAWDEHDKIMAIQ